MEGQLYAVLVKTLGHLCFFARHIDCYFAATADLCCIVSGANDPTNQRSLHYAQSAPVWGL